MKIERIDPQGWKDMAAQRKADVATVKGCPFVPAAPTNVGVVETPQEPTPRDTSWPAPAHRARWIPYT
jgi:hypothetical protein